jgi:hypothetical protein
MNDAALEETEVSGYHEPTICHRPRSAFPIRLRIRKQA